MFKKIFHKLGIENLFILFLLILSILLLSYVYYKSEILWKGLLNQVYFKYYVLSIVLIISFIISFFFSKEFYKNKTSSMVIQLGHQILDGKMPRLFEDSKKIMRDFINIEDVIQANMKACKPKKSGIYNIGTGNPRSFQDIADILQKELNTNLGTEYFPNPYENYQMHTQADISSSQENLGFEPVVSLEEGIKAYIPEIISLHKKSND